MTKIILIAINLLLPSVLLAQLHGMYCAYPAPCITFYEGNKFEYSFRGCLNSSYGIGYYEIKKNKLILNFIKHPDDSPLISANTISMDSTSSLPTDSVVVVDFQIYNERNQPLEYAGIFFDELHVFGKTDGRGYSKVIFPKSNTVIKCSVAGGGSPDLNFSLKCDKNYKIEIVLVPYSFDVYI